MKFMRTAFLGLGFLLAVSAAQGQEPRVKANIPFDFVVGDRVMPAGEYLVSQTDMASSAIAIFSEQTRETSFVVTSASALSGPSASTKLVFHVLGGRYFLSQIWTRGYSQGRQLRMSKSEIQLAKNGAKSEQLALAANLAQ
jgi:hypothetical protein